jgi:hypothetical protein
MSERTESFTVEFDCVSKEQKKALLDKLYEVYPLGAGQPETPAISSWWDGSIEDIIDHSKSAIASALAHQDIVIDRLKAQVKLWATDPYSGEGST